MACINTSRHGKDTRGRTKQSADRACKRKWKKKAYHCDCALKHTAALSSRESSSRVFLVCAWTVAPPLSLPTGPSVSFEPIMNLWSWLLRCHWLHHFCWNSNALLSLCLALVSGQARFNGSAFTLHSCCRIYSGEAWKKNKMLMKVLGHPGHGNSECCIVGNWTCFSFLKTSHLSPPITNWRGDRV